MSEGGGECGLENYRTLCIPCHKKVTKELLLRLRGTRKYDQARAEGNADIKAFFHTGKDSSICINPYVSCIERISACKPILIGVYCILGCTQLGREPNILVCTFMGRELNVLGCTFLGRVLKKLECTFIAGQRT